MRILVTGGGGFLGKALVKRLHLQGHQLISLARSFHEDLARLGIEQVQADIADYEQVRRATDNCEIVYHVAAKAGVWGPYEEYYRTNVVGTQNVLRACQSCVVPKLVYTSSPSVVHAGGDIEGADEALPYPDHYETHYPKTKAEAEKLVLAANGKALATVALRPHLIWGPEDNHLVPRIIQRAKAGRLFLLGKEQKLIDSIYVDTAVSAHMQAAESLACGSPCSGKAYFITQGEPWPVHDLINGIVQAAGLPPVKKHISPQLAYVVGAIFEWVYTMLRLKREPPMTRFLAKQLSTAHWFDITAAKRDFGFQPEFDIQEGLKRLRQWFLQP